MTPTYRAATAADGAAAARLIFEWSAETPWIGPPNPVAEVTAFWSGCFAGVETAWVAMQAGALVGFCVREDDNISGLYVARAARGQGVGKHLLDLAKRDRTWITVWAYEKNIRARAFYRREGLVEIGRDLEDPSGLIDIEHRWHNTP